VTGRGQRGVGATDKRDRGKAGARCQRRGAGGREESEVEW
jgi:hypothetical protein